VTGFELVHGHRRYELSPRKKVRQSQHAIVIEAIMRAGRRQKVFRQDRDWHKTEYAGISVISMTLASADGKELLLESTDQKKIC
jgi:hypothetical protein